MTVQSFMTNRRECQPRRRAGFVFAPALPCGLAAVLLGCFAFFDFDFGFGKFGAGRARAVVPFLPLRLPGSGRPSLIASIFSRLRSAQPSTKTISDRVSASAPGGTSRYTVVPAAVTAPLPTVTGATSCV